MDGRTGLPRELRRALEAATDPRAAAAAVVVHFARSGSLPSVYFERGGRLRCAAQHGYRHVYDGVPPGVGILGRTFVAGTTTVLGRKADIAASADYISAAGDVSGEVCVPLRVRGEVAGVLNIEVTEPISPELALQAEAAAALLAARVEQLGGVPRESAAERLARHAAQLAGARTVEQVADTALAAVRELTGLSSGMLALRRQGMLSVVATRGPLGPLLAGLDAAALADVASWVRRSTSVWTPGRGVPWTTARDGTLDAARERTHVVAALVAQDERLGLLMAADAEPVPVPEPEIALVELLAAQVAATVRTVGAIASLSASEGRFRSLAETSTDLVFVQAPDGRVTWVGGSAHRFLGDLPADLLGSPVRDLVHPGDRAVVDALLADPPVGEPAVLTVRMPGADGSTRWVELATVAVTDAAGNLDRLQSTVRDVTASRAERESLTAQSRTDPLTGLANRLAVDDRLAELCAPGSGGGWLLFVDLDRFKPVNDRLGHTAGDDLLRHAGARLDSLAREHDLVGRYGGDEFVVICTGLGQLEAELVATRVSARLRDPFTVAGAEVRIGASVGISAVRSGLRPADVLVAADEAMYAAKRRGPGHYAVAEAI